MGKVGSVTVLAVLLIIGSAFLAKPASAEIKASGSDCISPNEVVEMSAKYGLMGLFQPFGCEPVLIPAGFGYEAFIIESNGKRGIRLNVVQCSPLTFFQRHGMSEITCDPRWKERLAEMPSPDGWAVPAAAYRGFPLR